MRFGKSVWIKNGKWACKNHCPSAVYPADVEKCLLGCEVYRPEAEKQKLILVRPVVHEPVDYDKWTLQRLRTYAAKELGIKGASKILGGKKALIEEIKRREAA